MRVIIRRGEKGQKLKIHEGLEENPRSRADICSLKAKIPSLKKTDEKKNYSLIDARRIILGEEKQTRGRMWDVTIVVEEVDWRRIGRVSGP
jgi:hypothetical protein